MSSQHFETLEDDLMSLLDDVKAKQQKTAIRYAERGFDEAYSLLAQMEEQAKVAPISYRTSMLGKVRNYRRSFDDLHRAMQRIQTFNVGGRDNEAFDRAERMENEQRSKMIAGTKSLNRASESVARSQRIAAETDDIGVNIIDELDSQRESLVRTKDRRMENEQRSKMIAGTKSLNRASESVARSQRIAAETDDIGVNIIDELDSQRESLVRTKDRLTDTDSNLTKSRKILKSMALRAISSKLILIIVIVVQLAILAGLVYWKFFQPTKSHKTTHPTTTTTHSTKMFTS